MYLSEVKGQGGIEAKVVAASISPAGIPLWTIETKAPKFIDAEFEKHRMLSSNSSSSRAIPVKRFGKGEYYLPFDIRANEKGMQGYKPADEIDTFLFYNSLKRHFDKAQNIASHYKKVIHKQHLNRYLEPFLFQKKVVTATEWDNFFDLRLAPDAQPEIQELARCMKTAMEQVSPIPLQPDQWHLPYVSVEERKNFCNSMKLVASVARCARVSYMTHDNRTPDIDNDLTLYNFLKESKHLTPFEHQATPMADPTHLEEDGWMPWEAGQSHMDINGNLWSGNFKGWIQNRKLLEQSAAF